MKSETKDIIAVGLSVLLAMFLVFGFAFAINGTAEPKKGECHIYTENGILPGKYEMSTDGRMIVTVVD